MKCVINLAFFCLLLAGTAFGQAASEKLKKEQQRLEKKIKNTKSLLDKTKTNTEQSLNELRLIDTQIKSREELVMNFDNQVRSAELQINEKNTEVKLLIEKVKRMKVQYRKLLLYAYKHRNRFGKMMFIFSANSYNEAIKRGSYLQHIAEIQNKQFLMIRQHQHLISDEITIIQKEKENKVKLLEEKKMEKSLIEQDKAKQQKVYNKFKKEELKLIAQLKEDEYKKQVLKQKINAAIKKEIADAEAKRKKAEAEAEAKAKKEEAKRKKEEEAAKKKTEASSTVKKEDKTPEAKTEEVAVVKAPEEKKIVLAETKESNELNRSFEANKGKLPWPVERGSITEGFGKNAHPTLDNVYTNNNGIDISTAKGAQVRSVFEGEVTSVLNIPGAGKVVIIKHGNYRTVYSNLQDTYVRAGSKVNTKQAIGSLLVEEGSSYSVVHFEVHQVVGSAVNSLNPSLWVNR